MPVCSNPEISFFGPSESDLFLLADTKLEDELYMEDWESILTNSSEQEAEHYLDMYICSLYIRKTVLPIKIIHLKNTSTQS